MAIQVQPQLEQMLTLGLYLLLKAILHVRAMCRIVFGMLGY
jgi:hypothetical protein